MSEKELEQLKAKLERAEISLRDAQANLEHAQIILKKLLKPKPGH